MEQRPYNSTSWPKTAKYTYAEIVQLASVERKRMMADVHPKPGPGGAGKCTVLTAGALVGAATSDCVGR